MTSTAPTTLPHQKTEVAGRGADFSEIRYAQCWEDADILLEGLAVRPGDVCLSIASAGDNSLSLLACNPGKVIAVDLNPAQLTCVELRKAAYATLEHEQLLQLVGSRPCPGPDRLALYQRARRELPQEARRFWDERPAEIAAGIGSAGRFERYFALFRRRILPWIHTRRRVGRLLAGGTLQQRTAFYDSTWNTWRWRLLFKLFFSRRIMGRLGRDPEFFRYVKGSVSDRILCRAHHALVELNPPDNSYLQWILTGMHTTALPHALRLHNFEAIRRNLNRMETHCCSVEDYLEAHPAEHIDRFNLSDIFEYMSPAGYEALLRRLVAQGSGGSRLVYWNMLAPRTRPPSLAGQLVPLEQLAARLHAADKAFFYSRLVVEEVLS